LVRRAHLSDVDALVGLMKEFYAEAGFELHPAPAAQAFRALMEQPSLGAVWLAAREERPFGFVVLTFGYSMEFGGLRAFVDDLFVRPDERGRGVGAALLETVKAECATLGIRNLCVETGQEGHPARALYFRAGFRDLDRALLSQPIAPALHER